MVERNAISIPRHELHSDLHRPSGLRQLLSYPVGRDQHARGTSGHGSVGMYFLDYHCIYFLQETDLSRALSTHLDFFCSAEENISGSNPFKGQVPSSFPRLLLLLSSPFLSRCVLVTFILLLLLLLFSRPFTLRISCIFFIFIGINRSHSP